VIRHINCCQLLKHSTSKVGLVFANMETEFQYGQWLATSANKVVWLSRKEQKKPSLEGLLSEC